LHIPQVPPPPQAEGKKTFWFPKVVSNELPDSTSIVSPLMSSFTGPEGARRALAWSSNVTSRTVTRVKMAILQMMVEVNISLIRF
jgi:hypothetical protein